jgi:hypothetical protein
MAFIFLKQTCHLKQPVVHPVKTKFANRKRGQRGGPPELQMKTLLLSSRRVNGSGGGHEGRRSGHARDRGGVGQGPLIGCGAATCQAPPCLVALDGDGHREA